MKNTSGTQNKIKQALKNWSVVSILMTSALSIGAASISHAQQAKKPNLYVMFAFDGSYSLPMWQETREFAKQMTANGKPVKFTYFINSVYYLASKYKVKYDAPNSGAGRSAIGFGGEVDEVRKRYTQTNYAAQEGHEIANHAAGHFDGSKWSYENWKSEFRQFFDMMFDKFLLNNATTYSNEFPNGWVFKKSDMVGFRAPQLGLNNAMYTVLSESKAKYDTSKSAAPNYWPKKSAQGIWNFPLAEIPVYGTSRKTLSMDYNFYYVQSKGNPDPSRSAEYEEQTYKSYMNYIKSNYAGNRAPINIGHHFSQWNAGAYWRAMKRVVNEVCGMPEVKCVTYVEFMNVMEKMNPQNLQLLQAQSDWQTDVHQANAGLGEDVVHNASVGGQAGNEFKFDVTKDYFMNDPAEAHDEHLQK